MSLCGTDKQANKQLKIELLSQWKLEAEFRKNVKETGSQKGVKGTDIWENSQIFL